MMSLSPKNFSDFSCTLSKYVNTLSEYLSNKLFFTIGFKHNKINKRKKYTKK